MHQDLIEKMATNNSIKILHIDSESANNEFLHDSLISDEFINSQKISAKNPFSILSCAEKKYIEFQDEFPRHKILSIGTHHLSFYPLWQRWHDTTLCLIMQPFAKPLRFHSKFSDFYKSFLKINKDYSPHLVYNTKGSKISNSIPLHKIQQNNELFDKITTKDVFLSIDCHILKSQNTTNININQSIGIAIYDLSHLINKISHYANIKGAHIISSTKINTHTSSSPFDPTDRNTKLSERLIIEKVLEGMERCL